MLPPFLPAGRARPVALLRADAGSRLDGAVAPYVGITGELADGPTPDGTSLTLTSGDTRLTGRYDDGFALDVTVRGATTHLRGRRSGKPERPPTAIGLTLTGAHLGVWSLEGTWVLRGRVDVTRDLDVPIDPRDEDWLDGLTSSADGVTDVSAGVFGQLGLRDLRLVTQADGSAYDVPGEPGTVLLTATSAGPGFFDTAHTSVWSLDTATLELVHRSDLFFRRPDRAGVFGDHAAHLLRDGDRWIVTTSTWGDFDQRRTDASVEVTLATSTADLTSGTHVLDTQSLALPTDGLTSVGVWDPHLVRTDDDWLVAYVSASKFFRFHPVLASGPTLDDLTLRGAATDRRSTEGPTLARIDGAWRLLASDGPDNPRGLRERYPVFDLNMLEIGTLNAPYPTNIPWPTLVPTPDGGHLMVGFNGTTYGGRVVGYGSHGDVVFARSPGPGTTA
ncbi:hypothetical protein [Nocardioides salsibiostraticola]